MQGKDISISWDVTEKEKNIFKAEVLQLSIMSEIGLAQHLKGISNEQLAKNVGLTEAALEEILTASKLVNVVMLAKLANAVGISVVGKNNKHPTKREIKKIFPSKKSSSYKNIIHVKYEDKYYTLTTYHIYETHYRYRDLVDSLYDLFKFAKEV